MNHGYRTLTLLLCLLLGLMAEAQHNTADDILRRCSAELGSTGAAQMDFTIRGNGGDFDGCITVSGKAFAMVIPGVRVWFDGKTQWTLMEENKSVSISEPTLDELMESNPFIILDNYASRYKAMRVDGAPEGCSRVVLTPQGKSAAGIVKATLTVKDKTGFPTALNIVFDNGAEIQASVKAARKLPKPRAGAFRFKAADYDVLETVDLR
ncbi:MAG: outer-membrane lipoprotein carrier protein LolA [Muribaculaceae bacterium]|nr:outer-membrane lipoprotein carrier protein LolA [Muribaculaceae bacterium]